MATKANWRYEPDYAVPPGETIQEIIEDMGMSQTELAQRMGRPVKTINEIIHGKTAITPDTAIQLERVLGGSASFWNNRERVYRERLALLEEQKRLEMGVAWAKGFPVKKLVEYGLLKATDQVSLVAGLLGYFGVASPEAWKEIWLAPSVAFRTSKTFESSPEAVATWLRLGEHFAQRIECQPYNKERFKEALHAIRGLTAGSLADTSQEMKRLCAEAGVAVAFVPAFPGSRASGATYWLNTEKACILLSARYKSDDHFWFTFFHEAGHVLLHGKKERFIEGDAPTTEKEEEANRFAKDFLIPPKDYRTLANGPHIPPSIIAHAQRLGIAPGIIVGRLQHDGIISYASTLNNLKQRVEVTIKKTS